MTDRPTPETDAEHAQFAMGGFTLDFCRRLERERDEARAKFAAERWLNSLLVAPLFFHEKKTLAGEKIAWTPVHEAAMKAWKEARRK